MATQSKLIQLLHTKNSAIADVICWLVENANEYGVVENCTIREITTHTGRADKIAVFTLRLIETNGFGQRIVSKWPTKGHNLHLDEYFLYYFEIEKANDELIEYYLMLSELIDKQSKAWSDYSKKYKNRKS